MFNFKKLKNAPFKTLHELQNNKKHAFLLRKFLIMKCTYGSDGMIKLVDLLMLFIHLIECIVLN